MTKFAYTAVLLAVASVASANNLTINYVLQDPSGESTTAIDVRVVVDGANDGLLNYDLSVGGIDGIAGLQSDAISYDFSKLDFLSTTFAPGGFALANNLDGASGSNAWSAGASQFGAAAPVAGLGRGPVRVEGTDVVPGNIFDVDVDENGALVGVLNLGVFLDVPTLEGILGGGGTVYSGDTGAPIALDGAAAINVIGIPEPSTCILAGLALVGFAARRNG